jgi:hypothetical protein
MLTAKLTKAIRTPHKTWGRWSDRLWQRWDLFKIALLDAIACRRWRFWFYPAYWRYRYQTCLNQIRLVTPPAPVTADFAQRRYITIVPNLYAGIGHQLANWNTALILSRRYQLQFVHHPLAGKWESFLGFGEGEVKYADVISDKSLKCINLPRINANCDRNNCYIRKDDIQGNQILTGIITTAYPGNNVLFHLTFNQNSYDQTPTAPMLREKYWKQRQKRPIAYPFDSSQLNIAVHVRRGDVTEMKQKNTSNWQTRWLSNHYFVTILKTIHQLLPGTPIHIYIYSQGHPEEYEEFNQFQNVTFHLDKDVFQTFHGMVVADILVTSPSSFSYKAGFISTGLKIARYPWWHHIPQNEEWIRSNDQGEFDPTPLLKRFN